VATYVRNYVPEMKTTYTVAPAILFLDRLHRGKDMPNTTALTSKR